MCDGGGAPTALDSIPVGGGSGPLCGGGCFEDGSGPRGADDRRSAELAFGPTKEGTGPASGLDFAVTETGSGPRGAVDHCTGGEMETGRNGVKKLTKGETRRRARLSRVGSTRRNVSNKLHW